MGASIYAADALHSAILNPKVRVSRFQGDSDLNRDEYFFNGELGRVFEKGRLGLEGAYSDTSTLTSELTDTGLFSTNRSRISYLLAPAYTHFLTPALTATISGSVNDVEFEDSEETGFVNYTNYALGTSLQYAISDRTRYTAQLSATIFDTPDRRSRAESLIYQVGFIHDYSETTSILFSIGNIHSDIEFQTQTLQFITNQGFVFQNVPASTRENGSILEIDVRKQLVRGQLRGNYSRSVSPSSQGVQNVFENVFGEARWRFNQHLDAVASISYQDRRSQGDLFQGLDQTFIVANGILTQRLTKNWFVSGGYQYRRQERATNGVVTDFNELSVTFRYVADGPSFPLVQ